MLAHLSELYDPVWPLPSYSVEQHWIESTSDDSKWSSDTEESNLDLLIFMCENAGVQK